MYVGGDTLARPQVPGLAGQPAVEWDDLGGVNGEFWQQQSWMFVSLSQGGVIHTYTQQMRSTPYFQGDVTSLSLCHVKIRMCVAVVKLAVWYLQIDTHYDQLNRTLKIAQLELQSKNYINVRRSPLRPVKGPVLVTSQSVLHGYCYHWDQSKCPGASFSGWYTGLSSSLILCREVVKGFFTGLASSFLNS